MLMRKQKLQIRHDLFFMLSPSVPVSPSFPFSLSLFLSSEAWLQQETVEEPIPLCDQTLATLKYA